MFFENVCMMKQVDKSFFFTTPSFSGLSFVTLLTPAEQKMLQGTKLLLFIKKKQQACTRHLQFSRIIKNTHKKAVIIKTFSK